MAAEIPFARKFLYALAAVIIFFGGLEFILRIHDFGFYYSFSADLLGMPLLDLCRFRRVANRTVEFDPAVFWKFKPNQILDTKGVYLKPVRINNFGFRGKDFSIAKKPGTYRIVCLGDSVTFGWSVGDDETYPAQLHALLEKKYPDRQIEVINLGVTGYTSFQGKEQFLTFGQKLAPDLVIFGFGPNDRLPALASDREQFDARAWQKNRLDLLLSRSQIYKLVKSGVVYLERRRQGLSLDPKTFLPKLKRKVNTEAYLRNFETVKKGCDASGCQVILLNMDFPSLPLDPATDGLEELARKSGGRLPEDWHRWNLPAINQEISSHDNIPLLDLRALFSHGGKTLMVDNGHPNGKGHALIAERLAGIIEIYLEQK